MALTSDQITAQNFADFYTTIKPYLNGGGFKMKKLWENPNPTSAFAAQNITLSSSDYDILVILSVYKSTVEAGRAYASPVFVADSNRFRIIETNDDGTTHNVRNGSVNGTTVTFDGGMGTEYNVPTVIYGIKFYSYDNISCVMMSSTWEAGETTVEFTDPIIDGDSIFDVYLPSEYSDLIYSSLSVSGHTLTITFPSAQASDIEVKLRVNRG